MNTIESFSILSPNNETEVCAKFVIDDVTDLYTLSNTMVEGREYTFSCWIKTDSVGTVKIHDTVLSLSDSWQYCTCTFAAIDADISIEFLEDGVYYFYHTQLELGNRATDWSPSPEDTEEDIGTAQGVADHANELVTNLDTRVIETEAALKLLKDSISTLVRNADGQSLMVQDENGWSFSMGDTQKLIEEVQANLGTLENLLGDVDTTVKEIGSSLDGVKGNTTWIQMTTYQNQPCIALGDTASESRLLITNTKIVFLNGTDVPAYISDQALHIRKAVIEKEMQQGNFVWKVRDNGNLGLVWKGVGN